MTNKYPNSGSFSKNKRKTEEKHADISGSANIEGVDYWISGWLKNGSDGIFYSLSFKPKQAKPQSGGNTQIDMDDEIPFN